MPITCAGRIAAAIAATLVVTLSACSSSDSADSPPAPSQSGVPQITADATDLSKQPTIAAGEGTPPADLLVADLVPGSGRVAAAGDTVNVRYVGALYRTGEVFDASWKQGNEPVSFPLAQVVPGFARGIEGMKTGGRREIVIPPALGYGDTDSGPIPGGSTLVFVVDLTGIGPAPA